MADSEEAEYIEPKDISIVMYGHDNPSFKPVVNSNRKNMEPEYTNVKTTGNNRHFGIMIFVGVAVAVTCVVAAVVVVVSTITATDAVEALETRFQGFENKNIGNGQIQDGFLADDTQVSYSCADVDSSNPRQVTVLSDGMEALCDTVTDEGGWIVFQRRTSNETDFYQNWVEYKHGFGDIRGNFWFGLEKLYELTHKRRYELRVDLTYNGTSYFAHYDHFQIYSEAENYMLVVSGYSGDAGDSLSFADHVPFSTKDKDNDSYGTSCAQQFHGAWWYTACHRSNLNGMWGSKFYGVGLVWFDLTGDYDSDTFTEMKIRALH